MSIFTVLAHASYIHLNRTGPNKPPYEHMIEYCLALLKNDRNPISLQERAC